MIMWMSVEIPAISATVGLVDESWLTSFPPVLADRLRALIDTPGG
jgi:hypothetical protein